MLILAIILFGMVVGAGAQLVLGRSHGSIDWTMAIVAGLVGSLVGGLVISLLSGDGLDLRPSGLIGSLAGAGGGARGMGRGGRPEQARRGGPCRQTLGGSPQVPPTLTQQHRRPSSARSVLD